MISDVHVDHLALVHYSVRCKACLNTFIYHMRCFCLCVDGVCPDPGYPPGGYSYSASYEEDGLMYYLCQRTGYRAKDLYPILCTEVNGQLQWNSTDVNVTHECIGQCAIIM